MMYLNGYHNRFEWVDGALTVAIEKGGWVLLRGANLAAAAVLDRLNRCVRQLRSIPIYPQTRLQRL